MKAMFTGIGALGEISDAEVIAPLKRYANVTCDDPDPTGANCTLGDVREYVNAYLELQRRYAPARKVRTNACVGSPGFTYLAACISSGKPGEKDLLVCDSQPCKTTRGPPFPECRALRIACGGTCRSGATPVAGAEESAQRFCDATTGYALESEMEKMATVTLGIGFVEALFAIFYVLGLASTVQMYLPGIGQREGQRPTWVKLRPSEVA